MTTPCQCCGRAIKKRPRCGKLRYAHKCPHGRTCPAGDWRYGTHANGPRPVRVGGCPQCARPYGSDRDNRLYATVSGSHKLHILKDDGSGYYDAGALCGVWRNLGEAGIYPSDEFAGMYTVCRQCEVAEELQ